ncbi:hypothetical protein CRE_27660 [Caenorhabditis remanei]|uniref:PHD-type domain-containing protein n=1 Tax=Caenorhabditis remanei TaxID=31234 RepID=E3MKD0_CAERE|nr:hypothetical protein CRE_27660 [Caenorhabditis remanei]
MDDSTLISGEEFANRKLQDTCKNVCKNFGFTAVSPAAINKLSAILRSKINQYAHSTRLFMECTGRTQPIVTDVMAALKRHRVNMKDLKDYARQVTSERLHALPLFPVPDSDITKSDEAYYQAMYGPKPSERELEERKDNIPPYFRAVHPEWIEEEKKQMIEEKSVKKIVKSAADREQEEFNKLKRINTYRRNETPEAQAARAEKERIEAEEAAYAKKRNRERFEQGITTMQDSDLPNFEDMDYTAMGFFKEVEENRRLEEERILQEKNAAKAAAERLAAKPVKQSLPFASIASTSSDPAAAAAANANWQTNTVLQGIFKDDSFAHLFPTSSNAITVAASTVASTSATSSEDPGPTFKMSELVKSKPLLKLPGTASNPGSAPSSRPGSSMSVGNPNTPIRTKFGPGRPKKPKPEGAVVTVPKPKGRPPKKATLEKRKRLSEQIIAQQQKKLDEPKEEKEKVEKIDKAEKKNKKLTINEEIRDQLLRARSQMVMPNSVLQQATPSQPVEPPVVIPPIVFANAIIEPIANVPVIGATVDIEEAPIFLDEPALEVEINTDEPSAAGPSSSNTDVPLDFPDGKEKKKKKEKRDKNSEEYKEYKRQKKERRRQEKEERRLAEQQELEEEQPKKPTPEPTPTPAPTIKLKIKFNKSFLPTPPKEPPMRPDSTNSGSRPGSSKGNYQEDPPPPPPPSQPPLKFRFKNFFNLAETEEKKPMPSSPERPGSSQRSPSSSSSKHHKKDRKDKEHKKHKKDKERSREKEQEREERKERERQEKEAARREILIHHYCILHFREEKARIEMESKRVADEEEERRREKEKRREERKKEKERQKEKEERRKEKEERKEKERELEREKEREKEREREREREREKEREKERERERKREEEARKKREEAAPPPRPLISQEDGDSDGSESSEEIWVCPVCSVAYTVGANMVGCDQCQDWFHWHCVGITAEPTDSKWFCNRCSKGNKSKKHGKRHASGPHEYDSSAKRKKN